ncbi:MAG: DUF2490 domain-containing protein [Opitutaceae bacterium]|nr:DUF2490 domain-containing protein [Opitutaceae bacterium]
MHLCRTAPRLVFVGAAVFFCALSARVRAGDDFGSWHAVSATFLDQSDWTLSALGQLRFRDDSSNLFAYVLSAQTVWKASSYLRLGMNYTVLPAKPAGSRDFRGQRRWEIEVNPRWPVNAALTLDLRNRIEVRWIEGRAGTNLRSRHRPQATWRLKGAGRLESVYANNEFFWDHDADRYTSNRLVPLGLNFRVNPQTVAGVYYMLWSVRSGTGGWSHSHVLGTRLALRL